MQYHTGLYIHVPFCEQKCEYCDFYSLTRLDLRDRFTDALVKELQLRAPDYQSAVFHTVFWGGGTPSLLTEAQMQRIWQTLRQYFNISPEAEISLEANPGTLSYAKLAFLKSMGFQRLSMGVQSFHDRELKFLGRIHSREAVFESVANARKAGFENINLDLMTAFQGITRQSFQDSLKQAITLRPEHLSCYTLIFEPGTRFYKRLQRGELQTLSDTEEAAYYELAREILTAHHYQQYEISNFARSEAYICQHNLTYWQHLPYAGFGPSAHSFFNNIRFANRRSLAFYIREINANRLPVDFQEQLTQKDLMFEYIFLNLRLKTGINLAVFQKKFGISFEAYYHSTIRQLRENHLIELTAQHLRLTDKGWLFADEIAGYF